MCFVKRQSVNQIVVWAGFAVGLLFLISMLTSSVFAQQTYPTVDCGSMSGLVVAFDVSKGQNPRDVSEFLAELGGTAVTVATVNITNDTPIPACIDVLVVHGLANNLGLPRSYSLTEANMIKSWVNDGHGLMLSGDWGTFKYATQPLFQIFGYEQLGGIVEDVTDHDPAGPAITPYAWVIYQADNFFAHDILSNATTLQLQASGWLDSSANAIVTTDADASPASEPVMAAFSEGDGCVFLSADSNWYATDGGSGSYLKQDNAQIAQQTVEWLLSCQSTTPNTPPTVHTVLLPLLTNDYCPARGMDVILAIDSSESMLKPTVDGSMSRINAAQDAAVEFLSLLNFTADQAGVVSFDKTAVIDHTLSSDQSSIAAAINSLDIATETRIDLAFTVAQQELTGIRHENNYQIIVMLSDGRPWGTDETAVLAAANNAKAAGITIYTIGYGENANQNVLRGAASSKEHYYFSPSTAEINQIFTDIINSLPCYGE
jgi:hypothetical protein